MLSIIIGCGDKKTEELTIDFSETRDYRIINVFNQVKYTDYERRLPKNIQADAQSTEPYAIYSYFSMRPNNTYTFLIGNHFMHGTYTVKNPTELVLHANEFGDIPLTILKEQNGCIQIKGDFKNYKSDFMLELNGDTTYYLNLNTDIKTLSKENDYRSVTFNTWRNKPLEPETNQQIKQRIIANLNYISAYMRVHLHGEYDAIHTGGIHSPFLYAKNGLFLFEWQRVSGYWKYIFYDNKDAEKAYRFLKKVFNKVEPPRYIDNWLAYNEKCIEIVINELESEINTTP